MATKANSRNPVRQFGNPLFREIYKNSWLTMISYADHKKNRKCFWITLCVHDDTEAFLEAYIDYKKAVLHKPEWFVHLNSTQHISSTQCPYANEHVFMITLPNEDVRLAAASWNLMMGWVQCLRDKFVELKVSTPKENLYSKFRAGRSTTTLSSGANVAITNLLPIRDPSSPLPPPPSAPPAPLTDVDPTPATPSYVPNLQIGRHAILQRGVSLPDTSASDSPNHSSTNSVTIIQVNGVDDNSVVSNFDVARPASASNNNYDSVFNFPPAAFQIPTPLVDMTQTLSPGILQSTPLQNKILREQQVLQLQSEMQHPGGVRLQIRRKVCMNSIAFADAMDAIWICGWNQWEYPILYNTLHIGDRLLSIDGIFVQCANDVRQILRSNESCLYVSVVIQRVPFGRVFLLHRDVQGQSLGLNQEGNTATLTSVQKDGLAARHGLPTRVRTCDGRAWSLWVLTEINGRPLELFFNHTEVKDRLNAVGLDISILVQPLDLINQLKEKLRTMRNYKDYMFL